MASNSVDYIIRLVADDKDLKKKLSSGELLNKSEISKVKNLLISALNAAKKDANNLGTALQDGLNVDTTHLERSLEFISGVFNELEKTGNPIKDWAKTGKGVYKAFDQMQTSVAVLAQNVSTVQTGLNTLTTSFEDFKKSYQSFNPTQFANVSKDIEKVVEGVAKIGSTTSSDIIDEKSIKRVGALKQLLMSLTKENFVLKVSDDNLDKAFDETSESIEQLTANISKYNKASKDANLSDGERKKARQDLTRENTKLAQSYIKLMAIDERRVAIGKGSLIAPSGDEKERATTIEAWEKQILSTAEKVQQSLTKLEDNINRTLGKSFSKVISEQLSDIKLTLSLPNEQEFVGKINDYIATINSMPLDKIKVDIGNSADVIGDKATRAYGGKPADDDANTTALVNKTKQRFKAIRGAMYEGQNKILKATEEWRKNMANQLKFGKDDFAFNFGDSLFQSLQDYLNEQGNELKFVVDEETIKAQLKTIIENSGLTIGGLGGSGTAVINPDAIAKAVYDGMQAAVTGQPLSSFTQTTKEVSHTEEPLKGQAETVEDIVKSADKYVKTITEKTINVDRVVEALKDFASASTKKGAGRQEVARWLTNNGIDIDAINKGASDTAIREMLNVALMTKDKFGYARGATFADSLSDLKRFKISGGKQEADVKNLASEIVEMLNRMGINQEYWQESKRRYESYESYEYAAKWGRPIATLGNIRNPLKANSMKNFASGGYQRLTTDKYIGDLDSLISFMEKLQSKHLTSAQEEVKLAQQKAEQLKKEFTDLDNEAKSAEERLNKAKAEYDRLSAISKDKLTPKDKVALMDAKKEYDNASNEYAWNRRDSNDKKSEYWSLVSHKDKDGNTHVGLIEQMMQKAVSQKSVYGDTKKQLESFKNAIVGLGENPTEEAIQGLEQAARNFFEQTGQMMQRLLNQYGKLDTFQGRVTFQNGRTQDINSPYDFLRIKDEEIANVDVYKDILMHRWEKSHSVEGGVPQDFDKPPYYVDRPAPPVDAKHKVIEAQDFVSPDKEGTADLSNAIDSLERQAQQLAEEKQRAAKEVEELNTLIATKEQDVARLSGIVNSLSEAERKTLENEVTKAQRVTNNKQDKQGVETQNINAINADIYRTQSEIAALQQKITPEDVDNRYNELDRRINQLISNNENLVAPASAAYDAYTEALLNHEKAKKAYDNYIEKLVTQALIEKQKSGEIKKLAEQNKISDLEASGILRKKLTAEFNLSGRPDIAEFRKEEMDTRVIMKQKKAEYDRIDGQRANNETLINQLKIERDSLTVEALQEERDTALLQKQAALKEKEYQKKLAEARLKRAQDAEKSSSSGLSENVILQQREAERELAELRAQATIKSENVEDINRRMLENKKKHDAAVQQSQYTPSELRESHLSAEVTRLEEIDAQIATVNENIVTRQKAVQESQNKISALQKELDEMNRTGDLSQINIDKFKVHKKQNDNVDAILKGAEGSLKSGSAFNVNVDSELNAKQKELAQRLQTILQNFYSDTNQSKELENRIALIEKAQALGKKQLEAARREATNVGKLDEANVYTDVLFNNEDVTKRLLGYKEKKSRLDESIGKHRDSASKVINELKAQQNESLGSTTEEAKVLATQLLEIKNRLYTEAEQYVAILGSLKDGPEKQMVLGKLQSALSGLNSVSRLFAELPPYVTMPLYDNKQYDNIKQWNNDYTDSSVRELQKKLSELQASHKVEKDSQKIAELEAQIADIKNQIEAEKARIPENVAGSRRALLAQAQKDMSAEEEALNTERSRLAMMQSQTSSLGQQREELNVLKTKNELLAKQAALLAEIDALKKNGASQDEIAAKVGEYVRVSNEIKELEQKTRTPDQRVDALNQAKEIQQKLIEAKAQQWAIQKEIDQIATLEENVKQGGLTSPTGVKESLRFKSNARNDFKRSEYYNNIRDQKKDKLNADLDAFASEQAQDIIARIEAKKDSIRNQVIQKVIGKKDIDLNAIRKTAVDEYVKTDAYQKVVTDASTIRASKQADADRTYNLEVDRYVDNLVAQEMAKRNASIDINKRAKDKNISVEEARKAIEQEIRRDVEQQYQEEIRQFKGQANERRQAAYTAAKMEDQKTRSDARQHYGKVAVDKEIEKIAKDKAPEIKRKQEAAVKDFEESAEYKQLYDAALTNIQTKQRELWNALDAEMQKLVDEYIKAIQSEKGKVKVTDDRFRSVFNDFISKSGHTLSGQGEVDLKQYILEELAQRKAILKGESDAGGADRQQYIKGLPQLITYLENSLNEALAYGGFAKDDLANDTNVREIIEKTAKLKLDEQARADKELELANAIEELANAEKQKQDTKPYKDRVKAIKAEILAKDQLIDKEESEIENSKEQIAMRAEEKAASSASVSERLASTEKRLATSKENLASVKKEVAELEKVARETEAKHGVDSAEAERARLNLLYKQRRQKRLEKYIGDDEKRVTRWSKYVQPVEPTSTSGSSVSTGASTTPAQGGIFSGVLAEMKAIASSMQTTKIDTSGLATEETLRAIHNLLGGDGGFVEEEAQEGKISRNVEPSGLAKDLAMSEQAENAANTLQNALAKVDLRSSVASLTTAYQNFGQEVFDAEKLLRDPKYAGALEVAQMASKGLYEFPDVNTLLARMDKLRGKVGQEATASVSNQVTSESQKQLENAKAETVETEKQLQMFSAWARLQGDADAKWQQMDGKAESAEAWAKKLRASGYTVGFAASEENWDSEAEKYNKKVVEQREQQKIKARAKREVDKLLNTESEVVSKQVAEETAESIMTVGKAITIVHNAIGNSTAKTTAGMAKAYATKIHSNTEAVEAAKLLYNTPDSEFTSKFGRDTKQRLVDFHGAWRSTQQEKPKVPVEPEIAPGAVAKEVKKNVTETPAEAPITPKTSEEDYKKSVETVRGAIGGFRGRSDAKRAELFNSLDRDVLDATNVLQARVKANEATKEEIALYNKMVQLREASNRVKQQEVAINPNNNVKPNQQNAVTPNESVIEDDDLDPQTIAKLQEGVVGLLGKIDVLNQRIIQLEGTDTPEAQNEKAILQQELNETQSQVENISTMMSQIKENATHTEEKSTSMQTKQSVGGGGILGVMRTLARESTLKSVLTALSEIAKHNAMAGSGKPNSALGLLEQFRRMLELDAWEGRERVAYMDLATGSMSNTITGDDKEISISRLETLRNAYKYMDANAMVHTHANQEDPYFSPDDLKLFGSDLMQGITKQILLSKDNMTVLDMTEVKDIQGLLDALVQTEHNFEALAETAKKFGAQYVSKSFSDLQAHPQQFVKMLGIKGVESKLSETETRDSARKGVLAEDAKEAADMLQESTGRAIKKTVERVGVELETLTEKTDAKGNKTWTSQINNKFGKAMKATWNDVNAQNLDEQFGVGTKASVALNEYREKYLSLNRLVEQFNSASESEKSGLQKQINDLLPLFNKAEKELIDLIARKEQFLRNGESLGVLNQDSIGRGTLEGIATKEFFGDGLTPGQNIATAGTQATKNGRQLLVDVLNNGTISRYGIEVDEATGQVRKLMLAEGDLANAFQNVNKVMRQNEIIQANIAGLDITDESQLQHFLANAHSPELDAYNTALKEMQVYTADLWNVMKEGGPASSQELDYLMMLSERVLALGDSAQKTSLKFKNLWAQNPERVTALNINTRHSDGTIVDNRDQIVRDQMHNLARNQALASHQQYDFVSFDNDKLKYTLTDVYGNVQKVTMAWNELYQKVVITNDATVASLNPVVAKIEQYKQAIIDAKTSGYLSDDGDKDFVKAEQEIEALMRKVQDGTATFEELEAARKNALGIGEDISKTIKTNKKLYTGTTAINAVNRQQDKIVSTFGDDKFKESDVKIVKDYKDAYAKLMALYEGENGFKTKGTLYDPANQETLRQQAVVVQNLGRKLMSSITQADKLSQLVEQSGSYTDKKGNEHALGGALENLTPDQVKNLEATMRGYAQAVYGAGLENVKINKTTQTLTGTLRTSKDTVSDVAIQYNAAEQALFAYNKQERQSLSGAAAFIQSIKSKMKSLLHYTIGMHSIYRVFGEIRKGIQYVREIDSALTELRKVTDETEKTYDRFLNTASKTAGRIGSTIKEVVSSTADFARLGYSLEEATMMAESAQILMNVSEFTDVSTATDSLISSIQAFKYTAEESMGVVDILNTIGKQICRGYIVIYNRADNEKRLKARDSSDRVKLIF